MRFPDSLTRGARRLRVATLVTLVIVSFVTIYAILAVALGGSGGGIVRVEAGAEGPTRNNLIVAAFSGIPFAVGLWRLAVMLNHVEHGDIFTRPVITELRAFTFFVLLSALVAILLPMAFSLADALAAPPGHRRLTLSFDGGDFFSLLVSGLLFFVARLLGEAQRISEESSQIV